MFLINNDYYYSLITNFVCFLHLVSIAGVTKTRMSASRAASADKKRRTAASDHRRPMSLLCVCVCVCVYVTKRERHVARNERLSCLELALSEAVVDTWPRCAVKRSAKPDKCHVENVIIDGRTRVTNNKRIKTFVAQTLNFSYNVASSEKFFKFKQIELNKQQENTS